MDEAKRRRRAARGWLTRQNKRVSEVLDNEIMDIDRLTQEMKELEIRQSNVESAQQSVEILFIEDSEFETDLDEADTFLNPTRDLKARAEKLLANIKKFDVDSLSRSPSRSRRNSIIEQPSAQLPKIHIRKFAGQYEEWPEFWDKFQAIVDQTNLPTISKFSHLQSLLDGEAAATIKGLSLTEENYTVATTLLKERYGREERIIFAHIQRLLNIEVHKLSSTSKLWQLYNELMTNIRSLENFGVTGETYGVVLTPMVLSRLPSEFRLEWARVSVGKERDLNWLLNFLKDEISRRERSETYQRSPSHEYESKRIPSAAVLQNNQIQINKGDYLCCFCRKKHFSDKCWNLKKMNTDDIRTVLREKNLCYRCFRSDHIARDCHVNCGICAGNHNRLFCSKFKKEVGQSCVKISDEASGAVNNSVVNVNQNHRSDSANYHHSRLTNKVSVMQVISVLFNNKPCTVLFDTGSDKSYITTSCVKRVNPTYVGNENVSYACFGEKRPRHPSKRNLYEINYAMFDGNSKSFVVTEIPTIAAPMYREKIPESILEEFRNLGLSSLANKYTRDENICIDILIGLDAYWSLMTQKAFTTSHGLVAQESIFGWLLCGNYPFQGKDNFRSGVHHQNLCLTDISESAVRSFWELDHLGIKPIEVEKGPDQTLELFNRTVHFDGDRYEVGLPWKEERKAMLENNFQQAKHRMNNLEKKLNKDPNLRERYHKVLHDLEVEGIFEEVENVNETEHPVFYLPHRPVVKESSKTTKVRPVFDASAVGPNGVSLNDCMETGPPLTASLLDVLLRFRRWKFALTADISKAFLQIRVRESDRNVHRFLWKEAGSLRVMRVTRVPFGNTASPFLLNATIKFHLAQQPISHAVTELNTNLYVDDWLTGADDISELNKLKSEAELVMNKAHMPLAKWCSNNTEVVDYTPEEQLFRDKDNVDQCKVLGILWKPHEDVLSFGVIDLGPHHIILTKRVVLGMISRIFDPMGFLQPFVMTAKILFQGLWKSGLGWDDQLPETVEKKFQSWLAQLPGLVEFSVPRCFVKCSWGNKSSVELHAFGDSSELGYGACVYIKIIEEDQSIQTSLVIAKARLAPVKKVTLPRLELMGALLSARLVTYVKKALLLSEDIQCRCWTDSTVTLHWIKGDACRWKPFVANRVSEIQQLTSPECWGHCRGIENPADILTRGVSLESLIQSHLWLHGPDWLAIGDPSDLVVSVSELFVFDNNAMKDEIRDDSVQLKVDSQPSFIFPVERWGAFSKAIRICAFVIRFVNNVKAKKLRRTTQIGKLSSEELKIACTKLLADTQCRYFCKEMTDLQNGGQVGKQSMLYKMKPFLDENSLMRMMGRLTLSTLSYDEKHPIILPKGHLSLLIVRDEHVTLKHAGVSQMITSLRNKYWIIGLRNVAKFVKRHCIACCRHDNRLPNQELSPIPSKRIEMSPPFTVIGVDYAGPLFTADFVGKKFYILMFTCAVVRAIHIELVDSLALGDFLLAFRRFTARRGTPNAIISDNAKTFKAAALHLVRELSERSPEWQFITPRAPWCGGFWERMIKSIKLSLKKTLGLRCQTRAELETTLHQIESCINSRPLTTVYDDEYDNNFETLTPSHFLLGRSDGHRPTTKETCSEVTGQYLRDLFQSRNQHLDRFWQIWQKDYIRNLPLIKHTGVNKEFLKGSVCLIKEDNVARAYWPMGVIHEIFPGQDGIVRTVRVKTTKGMLIRPVSRICCLEVLGDDPLPLETGCDKPNVIDSHNDNKQESNEKVNLDTNDKLTKNPYITRTGRTVKMNRKYE